MDDEFSIVLVLSAES